MAEGVHARRPHDEVKAGRKQRCDQQVDQQHRGVRRLRREHRCCCQQQAQHGSRHQVGLAWPTQRLLLHAHVAAGCLRPAEQAPRAPDQHHRHHQKIHYQSQLGKRNTQPKHVNHTQPDADGLDLGDQQGCGVRARDGTHATHHHHHEGGTDGVQVHLQRGGLARQLQCATQPRQHRAQREHGREQPGLVDAQGAHHLAVLRGGAHQRAKSGAREQQPDGAQHQRTDHDEEQVVAGELPPQQADGTRKARRARAQQFVGAPEPQHRVFDDQHQGKRGQQLEQLGRLVDAAQQHHFDQRPEHANDQRGEWQGHPEAQGTAQALDQRVRDVDAHHEERAMGKVHDARHAKDQRQTRRHEEQRRRARQPVDELDDETRKTHVRKTLKSSPPVLRITRST